MYYMPYLLHDLIGSFWQIAATAIVTLVVTTVPKYVWRLYCKWREKRRERKYDKEWQRSLRSLELSVSGGRFVGKQKPGTQIGPRSAAKGWPPSKGKICSSHANRGKYGPWDRTMRGPNVLLRKARTSLHLTLASAAEKLEVEDQELGRWERGECCPSREMLARLCEGYGLSAEQLGYDALEKFYSRKPRGSQSRGALIDEHEGKKPGSASDPLTSELNRNE